MYNVLVMQYDNNNRSYDLRDEIVVFLLSTGGKGDDSHRVKVDDTSIHAFHFWADWCDNHARGRDGKFDLNLGDLFRKRN